MFEYFPFSGTLKTDPPESIHITGYEESKALQHESTQRLTCICTGGNPLCQPKWYKGDKEITEGVQLSSNGNSATSDLGELCLFPFFFSLFFSFFLQFLQ